LGKRDSDRSCVEHTEDGMGTDFSCFGGSGRLYRFDHSGTAKATAAKICEGVHREEVLGAGRLRPFAAH
jgi:hypothetical protein